MDSQNSFKHRLDSKELVLSNEEPAELDALRAGLFAEHQPQSETEALLVNEMAEQYWRLRRARRMEVLFLRNEAVIAHLVAAQRIMTAAERGFYKRSRLWPSYKDSVASFHKKRPEPRTERLEWPLAPFRKHRPNHKASPSHQGPDHRTASSHRQTLSEPPLTRAQGARTHAARH